MKGAAQSSEAVRRPVGKPGSPPHATPEDREEVHLFLPHLIDNLGQAPSQGDPRDLLTLPLLHGLEPPSQRARPARCLGSGHDQGPAEEAIAFFADVPRPDPIRAGADTGRQSHVAGQMLGTGETVDVPQLKN